MAIPGCTRHLSYMRIIQVEKVVRKNQRQLIYIHEKPTKILSRHGGRVHNVPAVGKYPEISRVYSLETVTTEGACLGPCSPAIHCNISVFSGMV